MPETLPAAEAAVRAWLRAKATVTALVGTRVYVGLPHDAVFPCVVVTRVGGSPDRVVAWDVPLLQLDCWGAETPDGTQGAPGRPATERLAAAVCDELRAISAPEAAGGAQILGAAVLGNTYVPDAGPPLHPRFVITAEFHLRAA